MNDLLETNSKIESGYLYSVICTQWQYGSSTTPCKKEQVRITCENLRKFHERFEDKNTYYRIEVLNHETGEIREYWNSHENIIEF